MNAIEPPIYVSRRSAKNLWQKYQIFPDRVELQFVFQTFVIPANQILDIEVRPSFFTSPKGMTWGIKLDNCDFCRHVLLRRKNGIFKNIAFTPDNPDEFARICKTIAPQAN